MPRKKAAKADSDGKARYVLDFGEANEKQKLFFQSRTLYTGYGGARGGGKTWALRVKAVLGAFRYPGIRILIIRKTYPELQSNHIEPILKMVPQELCSYNGTLHMLYFENGSTIKFGHWSGMTSEQEYQGQEYDWIFMDEATQFPEEAFTTLGGVLRGTSDIPRRFYITCNPGGVGHRWVKRLFIDRDYITDSPNPEENENPEDYTFIFATVEDNKVLMEKSPDYVRMLSKLPEKIRAAHRYGDWDAMSGAYFSEFNRAKHVCQPFQIPKNWKRYRAFDYGLDCFACGWFAVDENGRSYMYREFKQSGLIVQDAARACLERTMPDEKIEITYAPPDMWSRQKDTGKTMAEVFMMNGLPIVKTSNNRVQGHMQMHEDFADMEDGKPGLMIFSTCKHAINDITDIQADEKNPDDCAKEPHEVTHMVDCVRYYCVSRKLQAEAERTEAEIRELQEMQAEEEEYESYMCGGEPSMAYMGVLA